MPLKKIFRRAGRKRSDALFSVAIDDVLESRRLFTAPPLPVIPSTVFLITNYGASTASTNNATAIQAAINAASTAGGGTVEVPAGLWMSGPITLATKIRLQIDSGATLKALAMADYPNNTAPANWISTSSKNNVEVVGPGTLDGNGQDWWTAYLANNTISRPRIFNMTGSNTVYIHNLNVQNSPQFNLAISTTDYITIDGVNIYNPTSPTSNISPNTDGIDIGGNHWLIQNCVIDTGDDNVVVKPGSTASSDMTVTNCTFKHGHGLSIGGQTDLGLNGFNCTNIIFDGTTTGIRMKASRIAGGLVTNCTYDNITMYNVQYPINLNSYYLDGTIPSTAVNEAPQAITTKTPYWQNITISNLTATWDSSRASYVASAFSGSYCGLIWGLPEAPIKNVQLTNVNITSGKYAFVMNHVRNVHFDRTCVFNPNPSTNQDFISTKASTTVLPYDSVYWTDQDINSPTTAGNAIYDVPSGNTTVTGGGADFGTTATDQFNLTSTSLTGDAHFYAKVASQSSTNAAAKAGVMIRNSNANNAAFASVVVTPTNGVQFLWRATNGGTLGSTTIAGQAAPLYVRLSRSGSSFTAYYSSNGTTWTQIGTAQTVTMTNSTVLAGLAVTSGSNAAALNSAVFSNIELMQWLATPAASPSPVTGTTTALSSIVTNSLGDNLVTNTWSGTSVPVGAALPSFSPNATSLSGFSTATFNRAGTYTVLLTATDANGLALSSSLSITVNQTLTSIAVTPNPWNVLFNSTHQFTAIAKDQFGNAMSAQPTFTWALSPALGTVTTTGLYTAGATAGTTTLSATSSTISGTATINVSSTNTAPSIISGATAVPIRSGGVDYIVDPTGANSAYTSIQAAIDAVSGQTSASRARIYIMPGTYTQMVTITKPYISLIGLGSTSSATVMAYNLGSFSGTYNASTTLSTAATDFLASNITFSNTYGSGIQALAMRSSADRAVFNNCRFLGYQDTLLVDNNSRQYFKNCYIEGATDFIYGNATAVFDGCTINSVSPQYLTAPETNPTTANGLVFLDCTLTTTGAANSTTYLARPWHWDTGQYPSAIYIRTKMGPHIIAAGWSPWSALNTSPDTNTRFSEYGSMNLSGTPLTVDANGVPVGRVSWADPMTAAQAANYTLTNIFGPSTFWTSTTQPEVTGQTYVSQGTSWNPLTTLNTITSVPVTSAKLRVQGADDGGDSNLIYTWAATTLPSGATAPTFSANGTNAAKTITTTFSKAGTYGFTVTVTDSQGLTTTSTTSITIDQVLSSISVAPATATVATGASQQFTATGKDQFGFAMTNQPTFTWSISPSLGSIDANGLYTAAGTGTVIVTATSGSISGIASLTISSGNAAPTVATAASATPSTVTGTTTTLQVLGADDAGEANLTYTWSLTGTPPAAVSYSANGTNAAKSSVATFTKVGTYNFLVTITDAGGLSVTSAVSVIVNQTLTSIAVNPASVALNLNSVQFFSASALDQFGTAMSSQPTFTWSVFSGVGTISTLGTGGLYSSGATPGSAVVRATSGAVVGSGNVTVNNATPTVSTPAAASPSSVTGANSTNLSALGNDDGGANNLIYTWSLNGSPPAPVTYSSNGTNAAKNTTATFTQPGTYNFLVTITDTGGLSTTSSVSVNVSAGAIVLNGTASGDIYRVRANGANDEIYLNEVLSQTISRSLITSLTINGNDGNDTLILDYSNGDPSVTGGIVMNGGNNTDTLEIRGASNTDAFSLGNSGIISHGSSNNSYGTIEAISLSTGNYSVNANLGAINFNASGNATSATLMRDQIFSTMTITAGASVTSASTNLASPGLNCGNVTIDNAMLTIAPNGGKSGVSQLSGLSLLNNGRLELHDNDLIINYASGSSPYSQMVASLRSGLTALGGTGTSGITSTEIENQTIGGTIIAIVDDGDANIAGAITETSGFTLTNPTQSIVVKFTWFGDGNLDGRVDGSDYALIDSGFTSGGSLNGYVFGDYDYSGIIDGSDYALIDTGFIAQDRIL